MATLAIGCSGSPELSQPPISMTQEQCRNCVPHLTADPGLVHCIAALAPMSSSSTAAPQHRRLRRKQQKRGLARLRCASVEHLIRDSAVLCMRGPPRPEAWRRSVFGCSGSPELSQPTIPMTQKQQPGLPRSRDFVSHLTADFGLVHFLAASAPMSSRRIVVGATQKRETESVIKRSKLQDAG